MRADGRGMDAPFSEPAGVAARHRTRTGDPFLTIWATSAALDREPPRVTAVVRKQRVRATV